MDTSLKEMEAKMRAEMSGLIQDVVNNMVDTSSKLAKLVGIEEETEGSASVLVHVVTTSVASIITMVAKDDTEIFVAQMMCSEIIDHVKTMKKLKKGLENG